MLGTGSKNCTCSCKGSRTKSLYSGITSTLSRTSLTEAPLRKHFKAEVPSSHLHHVIIPNCPFLCCCQVMNSLFGERKSSIPKGMTSHYWIYSLFCYFGWWGFTVTCPKILNWSCFPVLWHQQILLAHADVLSQGCEENWVRSALELVLGKEPLLLTFLPTAWGSIL